MCHAGERLHQRHGGAGSRGRGLRAREPQCCPPQRSLGSPRPLTHLGGDSGGVSGGRGLKPSVCARGGTRTPDLVVNRNGHVLDTHERTGIELASQVDLSQVVRLGCVPRRSGGIGRRRGLKIPFPQGSAGSSPASGTQSNQALARAVVERAFCLLVGRPYARSAPAADPASRRRASSALAIASCPESVPTRRSRRRHAPRPRRRGKGRGPAQRVSVLQSRRVSSTRRFLARPSSVALSAMGFDSPYPLVVMREASIPFPAR